MEYTTSTYTWKIISIDAVNNHMIVEYTTDSVVDKFNLPVPSKEDDIAAHIDKFAPKHKWLQRDSVDHISEGMSGTSELIVPESDPGPSDTVQFMGTFHEEYIRALVYQVIEETKTESL
jgi:hypothetical protein